MPQPSEKLEFSDNCVWNIIFMTKNNDSFESNSLTGFALSILLSLEIGVTKDFRNWFKAIAD
jgi:hypothetical protein